ncbi:ATP phosphoribosyltransferase [Chloroflexota bacterium]
MDRESQIKIALPKGRLLTETASLLQESGWGISGYHEGARYYRLKSQKIPRISARLFHEKDIPIQIAMGNYDLGICGLDWIEELLIKYPSSALVKVKDLGYARSTLYMAASSINGGSTLKGVLDRKGVIRIVSEYPNLAESFAVKSRLKWFNVFPVWGAAEVYLPENADLALISGSKQEIIDFDLIPLSEVLQSGAFLIANKTRWETEDLNGILDSIGDRPFGGVQPCPPVDNVLKTESRRLSGSKVNPVVSGEAAEDIVWLALPDGHQQKHAINLLRKAGIKIDGYTSTGRNLRPTVNLDGVTVKVIRPQDMPLQVANGNFDLAITGRDWLKEHLYTFPSSPVTELLDLKFGRVKIVAVVSEDTAIDDISDLRRFSTERSVPFRVASEYVNIADMYARSNHFGMYRVVPTWGASEAFVPADADLLIENTETGQTLARHNLKVIDTLFESTACLVGNTGSLSRAGKAERMKSITEILRKAVEES